MKKIIQKTVSKIKDYFLKKSFSRELSKKFRAEIQKVLILEEKDTDKFKQEDYDSCYDRAEAMVRAAAEPVIKILAYATAYHRENCHGEQHADEKIILAKSMTEDDIDVAERGWWGG